MGIMEFITIVIGYKWYGILLCFIGWITFKVVDAKVERNLKSGKFSLIKFLSSFINEDLKLPSLHTHPLFTDLEYRINTSLKNLDIRCPLRKKMFEDIILIRHKVLLDLMISFVNDIEQGKIKTLEDGRKRSYTDLSNYSSKSKYIAKEEEHIPEFVYLKFFLWNDDRNRIIESAIESAFETKFLSSMKERYAYILTTYNYISTLTLFDAEKTLESINGDLDYMTYKDITCNGGCTKCPRKDEREKETLLDSFCSDDK